MTVELVDGAGRVLATVEFDPPRVESDDPELAAWSTSGVPGLEGVLEDGGATASERERTTPPGDPLWPLEVFAEAERRGWAAISEGAGGAEGSVPEAPGSGPGGAENGDTGQEVGLTAPSELAEAAEDVMARLLTRRTEGGRYAEGSSWEDAGEFVVGPGAAKVQMAIAAAQAEGKAWLTVDPHPRRYHGKCPECGLPVTALVHERIQVGERFEYGRSRQLVSRSALPADMQPSEHVDVSSEGVRLRCPRDGRMVRARPISGKFSLEVPCDARCTGAKGSSCECQCAGLNHGSAHSV